MALVSFVREEERRIKEMKGNERNKFVRSEERKEVLVVKNRHYHCSKLISQVEGKILLNFYKKILLVVEMFK